jgi:alpha-ketoglutarate-dependent taurine dioxygenase
MSEFEQYFVERHQLAALTAMLREHGIATFDGITDRVQLASLASGIMDPRSHRDADPDNITSIRPDNTLEQLPAGAGFSRAAVPPHTEGSSLPVPPRLLMLACAQPAPIGGATLVVDGAALYQHFIEAAPESAATLSRPGVARFGSTGFAAAIFDHVEHDRVAVRYRDDALVDLARSDRPAWDRLRTAVGEHQHRFTLGQGQGIILDNTRWLHGREAFAGDRLLHRLVGDPTNAVCLRPGFQLRPQLESVER